MFSLLTGCLGEVVDGARGPQEDPGEGASAGSSGSAAGGGPASAGNGAQGGATGGSPKDHEGGADAGGSPGNPGGGGAGSPGAGSSEDPAPVDAAASEPADAAAPAAPGPTTPGQGPTAEGTIVFSQDFENGRDGITFSPTNLPDSRASIVDDPLGQRGKVMRMQWLPGDNYRIGRYRPRANISNTGYYYAPGDRVSYAWGFMTEGTYIGATIAQHISGGDPIWMLRGQANGELDVFPGGGKVPFQLEGKKWYDIRVEVNYVRGGAGFAEFYINGTKVFTKRGNLPIGPRPHWDGGIYLTSFGQSGAGNSTPRTVYISNLSVGKK